MIEQNKYTDETIHVANWLLLSGEVDLVKVAAKSAASITKPNVDDDGDEWDEFVHECRENFAHELETEIRIELGGAMPDAAGYDPRYESYGTSESEYKGNISIVLFLPMIGEILRRVDWDNVASLILKHRPELSEAMEPATAAA